MEVGFIDLERDTFRKGKSDKDNDNEKGRATL